MFGKKQKLINQNSTINEEKLTTGYDKTELSDEDLDQVKGGNITQDVMVNKAKTADKAFQAMKGYVEF